MAQRLVVGKAAVKYELLWGQATAKSLMKKEVVVRQMRSVSSCANSMSNSSNSMNMTMNMNMNVNINISNSSNSGRCRGTKRNSSRVPSRFFHRSSGWSTEATSEAPEWQNPLHDKDPDKSRIMLDQFGAEETPEMVPLPPLDDGSSKVLAPPHIQELAERIVRLNMLEVKELVDRISEHFGIDDDDDGMDFAGSGGVEGGQEEAKVEEERTAFDLKLTGFDAKSKIKVIKEVRAITSLGLKDAKALVEGAPTTVKTNIKMEEAEELKAKLEAVGATVEIA